MIIQIYKNNSLIIQVIKKWLDTFEYTVYIKMKVNSCIYTNYLKSVKSCIVGKNEKMK